VRARLLLPTLLLPTLFAFACTSGEELPSGQGAASSTTSAGSGGMGGGGGGTAGGGGIDVKDPYPFTLGGQMGWFHDEGHASGYFNTYDAFKVAGPNDAPRKVHVFLPRDYESSGADYPVVYMNDGNTTFWPGGAGNKTWDVAGNLEKLYADKAIEPVIVVAIHPIDREQEYTHADWFVGHPCCGIEGYTGYVADHVKGWIDQHYRTKPEAESTAIVGSSHGGLAAFYMANRRPDRFGKAGCMSSSFWAGLDGIHGGSFGGGPLETSALVTALHATLADGAKRPRVWIDWGLVRTGGLHNELIEAAATTRGIEMRDLLKSKYGHVENSELFWQEDPQGEHDEDSWSRRFPGMMKALFATP
jgi:pimeloyl-ACP methyl ester carboxylesterase